MKLLMLITNFLGVTTLLCGAEAPELVPQNKAKVKLAVVILFDQMRGDYVDRWRDLFGKEGFRRIQEEGTWFDHCYYSYATTATGPGHATVLSGTTPRDHGIISNNWYDRKKGKGVYCADTERYYQVPQIGEKQILGAGPERMKVETLADVLKAKTGGHGKVFSFSLKDRSAILPAGENPDGVYWFKNQFVTSTFYRPQLHSWVEEYNKSGQAARFHNKDWQRFSKTLDYEKTVGPDDVPAESLGIKQGRTFPHPMSGGEEQPGKGYYSALATSPFGNDIVIDIATLCIEKEKLGQDETPDLLFLSFSANDLVGHAWGPDSQEVLDITLRSDALMARFLHYLDKKVGVGQYSVVITADHGICPLPEVAASRNKRDAKRVSPVGILKGAEEHLRKTFGPIADESQVQRWIEALSGPNLYLNQRLIKAKKLKPEEVAESLAVWLRKQAPIHSVYTRSQLAKLNKLDDKITARVKQSFHPEESGDLYVVQKPYYLFDTSTTGTTHGTPHDYDCHVPLLVFGPGVKKGRVTEATTPQQVATITAYFLGLPAPKNCTCALPETLKEQK